jgi:DNA modification methylase
MGIGMITASELKIKEEFKKLIPPLSSEEFAQLEQNCFNDGIRDAICTWQGYIIDGHNRYVIATKHGLEYKTEEMEFDNEDRAKIWIIENQLGRRNITDYIKFELLEEYKKIQLEIGKNNKGANQYTPERILSINDKTHHNTREIIAEKLSWSTGKTAQAEVVKKKAPEEVKQKLRNGDISINQAYKDIKSVEKKEELIQKKEEYVKQATNGISNKPKVYHNNCFDFLNAFQDNSIDLLFTDPPYSTDIENINDFASNWLNLALQKLKPNGRAYICIGAYPKEINAYLNVLLYQDKFIVDNPLIWTYRNTLGVTPKMKYNLNYQMILHLYSNESPELDISITNEMFSVQDINAPDGRLGNRLHTWQKPDELARRLIRHSTLENDLVVDCFTCTGTFLLEAARLNRRAVGCDIDLYNYLLKNPEELLHRKSDNEFIAVKWGNLKKHNIKIKAKHFNKYRKAS